MSELFVIYLSENIDGEIKVCAESIGENSTIIEVGSQLIEAMVREGIATYDNHSPYIQVHPTSQ